MPPVVFIMLDGVHPDALSAANCPTLNSLIERGASTMTARGVMPSVTLPCHTSIFHSVPPTRHGITTNTFIPFAPPEVNDMQEVIDRVVSMMQGAGYEFIWRSSIGENDPYYAWFIKRDHQGERTEHIHILAPDQSSAERIIFRDILRRHPEDAAAYEVLKNTLAKKHPRDRVAYTAGKTEFILNTIRKGRDGGLR